MNAFRKILIDWKKRLQDRKMYSIVIVIIGLVAIWGFYQYRQASQYRQLMENTYNRAFYDMLGYVDNVETLLSKSLATSSVQRTSATMQEAWRQANLAQENLSMLPIDQPVLAKTSKYLTQVGDYANAINQQTLYNNKLNNKQYKTLEELLAFSTSLRDSLTRLQDTVASGRLKWGWLQSGGTVAFASTDRKAALKEIESIDKAFQKYPALIYDGPFSDHMTDLKPRGITGNDVDEATAKKKAMDFLKDSKVSGMTLDKTDNTGALDVYSFNVTYQNSSNQDAGTIEVTKKGGNVYMYLRNRNIATPTIDTKKSLEIGDKFLKSRGFKHMQSSYYLINDGIIIINYAYKEKDTLIYSDLIKLSIAMDTGEIIGFEGKGFYYNHKTRNLPTPKYDASRIKGIVNKNVKINNIRTVVIPTIYGTETYCQEVSGMVQKRKVLVYFNAMNGREEDILMLLESDNGTLTL